MKRRTKNSNNMNTPFFILLLLGTAFYYREPILKFVLGTKVKDLSEIIAQDSNVKISNREGTVRVSKNEIDYYEVDKGESLEEGDVLRTSTNSSVTVSFGTNFQNQFILGPNSTLELDSLFSNKEGIRSGSSLMLVNGVLTSFLTQLEGVEYKVSTGRASYVAKEGQYFIRKLKNGDDLISVRSGSVEKSSLDFDKKPVIKKGQVFFFHKDNFHMPVSDPSLSKKIQDGFENQKEFQEETLYKIHSKILGRIDKVKIILTIKKRMAVLKQIIAKKIKTNTWKINRIPVEVEETNLKYKRAQKSTAKDIECLTSKMKCVLLNEAVLLKRGMVMTSGRKKHNKESVELLRAYLLEIYQKIDKYKRYSAKLKAQVGIQELWISQLNKVEKHIYPELGVVEPKVFNKIVDINKEIKDKHLKRFMEMAGWIPVIQVLE